MSAEKPDDLLTARQISEQYDVTFKFVDGVLGRKPYFNQLVPVMTWACHEQERLPRSAIPWPERKPCPEPYGGRVYFIQHATGGLIKIGVSVTPRLRLKGLNAQTHDPRYRILKTERGGNNRESMLHDRFAHLRRHGEWFEPAADLLEYIEWLGYVG